MENNNYKDTEIKQVSKTLNNIGINMFDNDGNYRPFNEVMIDLGATFKKLRANMDQHEFELLKYYVLTSICGHRYRNEFMC